MTTDHSVRAPRRVDRARRRPRLVVPLVLLLLGVNVLLYPVVATQYNNVQQQAFATRYNADVQRAAPDALAGDLSRAHAYNKSLSGVPILDPWLQRANSDPGSHAYKTYQSELGRFDAMARLRVPTGNIDLPVYHGTSDPILAKGVGHLYGTSLPVGGEGTHAVLTSHTGLSNASLFDHLTSVKQGDLIYVDVYGATLAYRVDQIKVVLPDEIGDLKAVPGHDYLTLFTCTPYAVNTHRLLVRGERVPFVATSVDPATSSPTIRMETWMWLMVACALAGLVAIVALISRAVRPKEARRALAPTQSLVSRSPG